MKKTILTALALFAVLSAFAYTPGKREPVWPKGKMPDPQPHQIAAMHIETQASDFKPEKHREPALEWMPAPENPNGGCVILLSGGGYFRLYDHKHIDTWTEALTAEGFQCVHFLYRTSRPEGLPFYQTAWEDGQRAVRVVRSQAEKRGFDPEKIGTISMSAGSHLALLLATSSTSPAYAPVDKIDSTACNINFALVFAPAYATTDGEYGGPATRQGIGPDIKIPSIFKFDEKTCPMSLHHGGLDRYSPIASTLVYRQLRRMKIPAELHLYAGKGHDMLGLERGIEFLRQMGFARPLEPEVKLMDRYTSDDACAKIERFNVWPEGKTPCFQENQNVPYLEWHTPKVLKTKAIQILYSGGGYNRNKPEDFEVAPFCRYLNEKGMTVVVMKYRCPRPEGLPKHITAWQDLQRTIRIVRSEAAARGLNPDKIGIMGSSAGGHLTLMGVTTSRQNSYLKIDDIDDVPCNVQWGVGIYPAYALTDGLNQHNTTGGNDDSAFLAPEFAFDLDTAPMLFIHGDADGWASMNSVKAWEKMRAMGIQSELHTLALRKHCFQRTASPGTGSYNWMDRIWDFLQTRID